MSLLLSQVVAAPQRLTNVSSTSQAVNVPGVARASQSFDRTLAQAQSNRGTAEWARSSRPAEARPSERYNRPAAARSNDRDNATSSKEADDIDERSEDETTQDTTSSTPNAADAADAEVLHPVDAAVALNTSTATATASNEAAAASPVRPNAPSAKHTAAPQPLDDAALLDVPPTTEATLTDTADGETSDESSAEQTPARAAVAPAPGTATSPSTAAAARAIDQTANLLAVNASTPSAAAPSMPESAAEATPPTGILAPPDQEIDGDTANVARVARGLQHALNQRGGSVTLRLSPPELGFVRIELQVSQGTVSASLQSETPHVQQLLNQQLAQLRSSLENQGLTVERLQVQNLPTNTNNSANSDASPDHRAPTDDGRSRGHFNDGASDRRDDHANHHAQRDARVPVRFADIVNELA